jgi:hypothetical protein
MQQKNDEKFFNKFLNLNCTRPHLNSPDSYTMADKKDTKPADTKPEDKKDNKDEKKDQPIRALDEGDIHILRTYVCTEYFYNILLDNWKLIWCILFNYNYFFLGSRPLRRRN